MRSVTVRRFAARFSSVHGKHNERTPFSFAIDVPDGLQTAHPAGQNRFTLRQTPIAATPVPEPATAALMGTSLLCLAVFRITRKRPGQ